MGFILKEDLGSRRGDEREGRRVGRGRGGVEGKEGMDGRWSRGREEERERGRLKVVIPQRLLSNRVLF